ncbi:MAG: YbaB/EbfC family nucleoid-associated protein [Patescibacteria group bacterium]|nr:YbaB/EbfC family nucleoid-associated protein [Patescibacteria group bacterium]
MFDKIKDMYGLQKQAKQIKKKLKNMHIEAEYNGVIVTIDGQQEIIDLKISDEAMENKSKLEDAVKRAFEKALKKSQQIAAEEMKGIMGGLGLPGGE